MFGTGREPPAKKHSSVECLAFALDAINTDNGLVRMHVNTITDAENSHFNMTLWPSVFQADDWFRESTHRPSAKDAEEDAYYSGSDKVVRTFVNEAWEDAGHVLIAVVTEEYGELSVEFDVKW